MKKYGDDVHSGDSWEQMAQDYSDVLKNDYHHHRLAVIDRLMPAELYREGTKIFDFGCGDAIHFDQFLNKGVEISGMDISSKMIELAKGRLGKDASGSEIVAVGGAAEMAKLQSAQFDAIFSFNVLAYLTHQEEETFYEQARRILKPGGFLIVTHSNELFDMFSLNQYTLNFFARHFLSNQEHIIKLPELLSDSVDKSNILTYNVRENPLSYKFKLEKLGFIEQQQEFINLHLAPPAILGKNKSFPDTLSMSPDDRWKLMFTCSTYGSRSMRTI